MTPIFDPESCLMTHQQYVCSTCGRCIYAEADSQNKYKAKTYIPHDKSHMRKLSTAEIAKYLEEKK